MPPKLQGIDHVHLYVASHARAEAWYADVLGYRRLEEFLFWATGGGPLTLESPEGTIHLALFEHEDPPGSSAVAFGATGDEFLKWWSYLSEKGLEMRLSDHTKAFSLYFEDLDRNLLEITTYEHDVVRATLGGKATSP